MALLLKPVDPARGARWIGDAFRLFGKRPLPFTLLFVLFFFAASLVSVVPLLGSIAQLMMVPLLSLGFMVASQSALLGGPVQPGAFLEPLRGDAARRRSLLILCALYGVTATGLLLFVDAVTGSALSEFFKVMLAQPDAEREEVQAVLADRDVTAAALWLGGGMTLLTIPFWHAPALVHWGGQGVAQALFSSTLAVWRCRGAFVVYALGWLALMAAFGIVSALVFGLLGAPQVGVLLALPVGLLFTTVFYVSLIFSFTDSFGGTPSLPEPADGQG
ncbi:MAG: hypothetical protein MUF03_15265 [Rubrivivax sp.]|jgi:hypothetical protein|nr:hypothetical protein [Rubrivivax sp.]